MNRMTRPHRSSGPGFRSGTEILSGVFHLFIFSPLVLFLGSCGNSPTPDATSRRPVIFVEVEIARQAAIASNITATGTITSKNEVKIIAQAEGKIEFLGVEEGDEVRKGETLVKLDATILAAQTKEAEANVDDAKANFDRLNRLFKASLVSEQEFEQSRTRYNVLKARLEYQRALLKYTIIQAPISGVITYRGVREGDLAVPRAHLLTVSDPTTLVMEINISELEVSKAKVGDPVRVRVDAYADQAFHGTVRRIFPSSDALTRQVKVEVELKGNDSRLFPGLFARAELITARKENATVLSNDALLTGGDGNSWAFVVVDSLVQRRELRIGIRDGRRSEILDGIQVGEKVVVAGQNALNSGMVVRITKER